MNKENLKNTTSGKASLIKQLNDSENYFSLNYLKKYNNLTENQKKSIIDFKYIKRKIVYKKKDYLQKKKI